MVADRLCEGGAELEIIESFLDDDEGLEAVARFLGGELGPECRVARYWVFFQYKKGSISIQDIIIYHLISCRYHDISLCIISSIMIYHVPRRIMIYRDIIFFFSPCDIMSRS